MRKETMTPNEQGMFAITVAMFIAMCLVEFLVKKHGARSFGQ